jgi:hypothetical protein
MASGSTSSITGVQPRVHLHDGDAGLGVAGFDRAVNRRRAAPTWQQRGVDVEAAQTRQIKHPLRQDQAVRSHDDHVGLSGEQRVAGLRGIGRELAVEPQASGLRHGDVMIERKGLDG